MANLQGQEDPREWLSKSVKVVDIAINRKIHLYRDIRAILSLIILFYKSDFSLVHSVSPKAGLLSMLASWLVRVPVRIHTFTGQVWATKTGINRALLKKVDWLIDALTTTTLVDSYSQRDFLFRKKVITSSAIVLAKGSISGVDVGRFKIDSVKRKKIRQDLNVTDSTVVLLFLGRLTIEKGILELIEAFSRIHHINSNTALWIVGLDEGQISSQLAKMKGVSLIAATKTPEYYMASADIFCLPSYREGFGSVIIEAAACGVPSIGSKIYGLKDAIVDGETGILVSAKSVNALATAMQKLIDNKSLRQSMGKKARERAIKEFSQDDLTKQLVLLYKSLLTPIKPNVDQKNR